MCKPKFMYRVAYVCAALLMAVSSAVCAVATPSGTVAKAITMPELSGRQVQAFLRDSNGFMWLGTRSGIYRYDGYALKGITIPPPTSAVHSIAEGIDGKIWFATVQGVYSLAPMATEPQPLDTARLQWRPVQMVRVTSDGSVWVSQTGVLRRFDSDGNWANDYPLIDRRGAPTSVSGFCQRSNGDIYIASYSPVVYRYNMRDDTLEPYARVDADVALSTIIDDPVSDCMWMSNRNSGIYRFDPSATDAAARFVLSRVIDPTEDADRWYNVHAMSFDARGNRLWVATRVSILQFDKTADGHLVPVVDVESGLRKRLVETLMDDGHGLWIADMGCRTLYIPHVPDTRYATLVGPERLTDNRPVLFSIVPDDSIGYYWLNQARHGLLLVNPSSGFVLSHHRMAESESLRLRSVSDICRSRAHGGVWVSLKNSMYIHRIENAGGVMRLAASVEPSAPLPDDAYATCIHEDASGRLWVGSNAGLYRIDGGRFSHVASCFVTDIAETRDGTLWAATRNSGMLQCLPSGEVRNHSRFNRGYACLSAAPDGTIWMVSADNRLESLDPETLEATDHMPMLPAISDQIIDVATDSYSHVWIQTVGEIIEFSPRGRSYRIYPVGVSPRHVDSFLSPLVFDTDGSLICGGSGGAAKIRPSNALDCEGAVVAVALTDVSANGRSILDEPIGSDRGRTVSIDADSRNITFHFSSFDYGNTDKIRYAYRLEPYDKEWNFTAPGENRAFYNHLPRGSYKLCVRATDSSGVLSKNVVKFGVYRRPAFYETWWAYMIYVALAAGLIYLLVQYNIRLQKRRDDQLWQDSSEMMRMRKYVESPVHLPEPEFEALDRQLLEKAASAIEEHLADPDFGVEHLASAMNMSRSTLSRKLKAINGSTPLDMIRDVRMRHARHMLETSRMNVAEVAEAVGFVDRRYFSASFKKVYGLSPSEYQRRHSLLGLDTT